MLRLALQFMTYDKPKSMGALLGVILSIFLIGQQTGIFSFITTAMKSLVEFTETDLWVVDPKTTNMAALSPLDIRILREVESVPGVAKTYPLVVAGGQAKFASGKTLGVLLVGSEGPNFYGGPWRISKGQKSDLVPEYAVSYDYFDRKNMGQVDVGTVFEINNKRAKLALQTKGVRSFGGVYMFTTVDRARYYSGFSKYKTSAVLVKLQPGANATEVRDRINQSIHGVKAWLPADFGYASMMTVLGSSGIAISIGTLVIFAIISGFVIIGLTLFSMAVDRIKDYGTLKAIGATNGYISRLIFLQAFLIGITGYLISMGLLELFRNGIANMGTIFYYTWPMRLGYLALTLIISLGGAAIAVRRITRVEPASVFRM